MSIIQSYRQRESIFHPWTSWDDLFTDEDLARITALTDQLQRERASVGRNAEETRVSEDTRRSNVAMLHRDPNTAWLFDRLNVAAESINSNFYRFELEGFDQIQFAEYLGDESGMYEAHMDMHLGVNVFEDGGFRRLSMTLLLDEPGKDFEGGELQYTMNGTHFQNMEAKKGRVVGFPSWLIHRVRPVTRGVRRSLVVWVIGPK